MFSLTAQKNPNQKIHSIPIVSLQAEDQREREREKERERQKTSKPTIPYSTKGFSKYVSFSPKVTLLGLQHSPGTKARTT